MAAKCLAPQLTLQASQTADRAIQQVHLQVGTEGGCFPTAVATCALGGKARLAVRAPRQMAHLPQTYC